jgi:hypothetical protein
VSDSVDYGLDDGTAFSWREMYRFAIGTVYYKPSNTGGQETGRMSLCCGNVDLVFGSEEGGHRHIDATWKRYRFLVHGVEGAARQGAVCWALHDELCLLIATRCKVAPRMTISGRSVAQVGLNIRDVWQRGVP